LNLSFVAVTLLTALTNVLMAVTQAHWGRLADHFGNKPVLRVGAYLIALTPLVWLTTAPGRAWPIVAIQVLSGVGWSAFHVSQNNLALKLAPETSRPSYLALFGAVSGLAEGLAPLAVGILLSLASGGGIPGVGTFRILMLGQLVLFGATSFAPGWIQEPGGRPVGHLIRVMARFRSMDASRPVSLVYEYAYTHLARIADMVALEFPRDAETLP
jgi:MFS family permease